VTEGQASAFAATALANVVREYPRRVGHLLTRPDEDLAPRKVHPAFYGSYDWHSAVHMHWLLVRVLRLFPVKSEIQVVLDRHLSPPAMAAELAYFHTPAGKTFERPYGWAWLLELQADLLRLGREPWSSAVEPLAAELARRMARFVSGAPLCAYRSRQKARERDQDRFCTLVSRRSQCAAGLRALARRLPFPFPRRSRTDAAGHGGR
jgi:Protein of unknown function (DUF2891)